MSVINVKRESYKAMNSIKGMLLVLCLGASCANAAVITQTQSFPANTPGSSYDLTFDKFDTQGGKRTLDSVQIIFHLYMYGGSVAIDNDSELPQSMTANISLIGGLTSGSVSLVNGSLNTPWATVNSLVSQTFNLASTTGDDIGSFNATGQGDYAVFVGPDSSSPVVQTRDDYVGSAAFAGYQGAGTYVISASTVQTSNATGSGQYSVTMMQTYGDVTVVYNYTPVPEPATASLACAGLLMLLRRRRQA